MNSPKNLTGIILSGGRSLRMGKNKAFIEIEGIPMIERTLNLFEKIFNEILIITNDKDHFHHLNKAKIYNDLIPFQGALGGLYTGLYYSTFEYSFCVGCDMPFLKEPLIKFLIKKIIDEDIIVPKTKDGLEPLHAIYSKRCLKAIKEIMDSGKTRIIDVYPLVKVKIVEEDEFIALDPERKSFLNINTPEDLNRIIE
ncbi:MAG: molybdenum cofactor guanylyltransferase [Thermodesulfobacteriota bacterium]